MTLHTKVVAGRSKLETVRLVAIAAGHTGIEHPTLDKRAVFVVLLFYLAVGEIVVFVEQREAVIIAHRLPVHIVFVNLAAPRVASRAHLYFSLCPTRRASTRIPSGRIDRPRGASAFVKRN